MAADFGLGIEVEAVPTVRAADGLALSSRNKYLSEQERAIAPVLYRALSAGAAAAAGGPAAVLAAARTVLADGGAQGAGLAGAAPGGSAPRLDYLALADARSYESVRDDDFDGPAVLAVAARIGSTRLIDNVVIEFGTEQHAAGD